MSPELIHFLSNIQNGDRLCLVRPGLQLETKACLYHNSNVIRFECFDSEPILGWADTGSLEVDVARIQNRTAWKLQGQRPEGTWVWDNPTYEREEDL